MWEKESTMDGREKKRERDRSKGGKEKGGRNERQREW